MVHFFVNSDLDTHKTSGDHDGRYYTESEVNTLLNGKSNTGHYHDDRYYTESEINTLLSGKTNMITMSTTTDGYNTDWISEIAVQCMQIEERNIIHISANIIKPISGIGSASIAIANGLNNVNGDWEVLTVTQRGHLIKLYGSNDGMVMLSYIRSFSEHTSGWDSIVGVTACVF